MSLIATYSILFETKGADKVRSDTKQTESAAEKSAQATEKTGKAADKSADSFKNLATQIIKTLAPIAGLAALLNRTLSFASQAEEMSYLAQNTGMAVEKFQALAIAAENYGGSAEGIAGSMQGLNTNLQNMKFGKGGGGVEEAAITYGINLYGENGLATAEELLMNVAERFESLDSMQQLDLGQRLGLDEGTIRLLQTGVANVQKELERGAKYSLFSEEDIENSRQFQRTMRDIKLGLSQIFGIVARSLLPAFTWLGDKISNALQLFGEHSGFILGFLGTVSAALGVMAIKAGLAFAPFLIAVGLITAVAAAIGLLIDDIVNFWQGNESLIGTFIDGVKFVFDALWDFIKEGFQAVLDWLADTKIGKWVKGLFGGDDEEDSTVQNESEGTDADPKVKQEIFDMADAKRKFELTQTPLAAVPQGSVSASYSNQDQSVKIDNITINTQATDAAGIATDLNTQMRDLFMSTAKAHATSRIS